MSFKHPVKYSTTRPPPISLINGQGVLEEWARNGEYLNSTAANPKSEPEAMPDEDEDMENFLDYSTVHGVKDIAASKSACKKIFWIILFLGSLAGMSYELGELFKHFVAEQTASLVTTTYPKHFPKFILCPAQWANVTKAREMGVTAEMFHELRLISYWRYEHIDEIVVTNVTLVQQQIQDLIMRYDSLDQVYYNLSFSPRDIVDYLNPDACDPPLDSADRFISAVLGMCFKYVSQREFDSLTVVEAEQIFAFANKYSDFAEYDGDPTEHANYLLVGDMGDNIRPNGEVYLQYDKDYVLKIGYKHIKHANLNRQPCKDWTTRQRLNCIYECGRRLCIERGLCELYVPGIGQQNFSAMCSIAREDSEHCINVIAGDMDKMCSPQCAVACEFHLYQMTLIPYREHTGNESVSIVYASFNDPTNSQMIVENKIYDANTMISNVGGTMSLWCGASIMSLMQVLYYLGLKPFLRKTKKILTVEFKKLTTI